MYGTLIIHIKPNGYNHLKVVMENITIHLRGAFGLKYPEFLDSCISPRQCMVQTKCLSRNFRRGRAALAGSGLRTARRARNEEPMSHQAGRGRHSPHCGYIHAFVNPSSLRVVVNTIRLLDFLSLPHDTHLSRPAGLQVSARRIQLTSVGVFLLGRVA